MKNIYEKTKIKYKFGIYHQKNYQKDINKVTIYIIGTYAKVILENK